MRSVPKITVLSGMLAIVLVSLPLSSQGAGKKGSGNRPAASVDGSVITEAQVRTEAASDLDSLELQMLRATAAHALRRHEALEESLQRLLEEKLLAAEAAKRGISQEQLLSLEIKQTAPHITAEDIDRIYEANRERLGQSKEEAVPRIERYLRKQGEIAAREAFLRKLEQEHQVIRSLEPLRFDVKTAGSPSLGPKSAPVTLIAFTDFQCPYCKDFSETLQEILKAYANKVRLVLRQFPLTEIHPDAQRAAEASLCANAQNRFWEMHDALFRNQDDLKEGTIKAQAREIGLDAKKFDSCLESSRYRARVREDLRAGSIAGTDGTPAIYINGRYLNGSRSYEEIASIIDEELAEKK